MRQRNMPDTPGKERIASSDSVLKPKKFPPFFASKAFQESSHLNYVECLQQLSSSVPDSIPDSLLSIFMNKITIVMASYADHILDMEVRLWQSKWPGENGE